ncbi:MAG: Bax inhibitor-1/YccA family protein [Rhizomicrobium sp.]|nr:Bax inhibitor-1/YccA family protein [Rhizomicrobium sp.]
MADFDSNRLYRSPTAVAGAIDAGLRKYMLRVYNYMTLALVVTGVVAYGVYTASATTDPETGRLALTQLGYALFASPLKWVLFLAPVGMVLFISARLNRMSLAGAQVAFWVFAGLIGISMASIFMLYTATSVAQVFFITAAAFGGLSLYGYTTKTDLSAMGSFLIMGVWGLFLVGIVNIFFHSPMVMWIMSVAGVGIFAGLTAYDTQSIKEMYYDGDSDMVAGKKAIIGALRLYLDFINMFQFLLYLMGGRR